MKKVYILTASDYADNSYRIVGVFSSYKKAVSALDFWHENRISSSISYHLRIEFVY